MTLLRQHPFPLARRSVQGQRGMAFALIMLILLTIMALVLVSVMTMGRSSLQMSSARTQSAVALDLADAGSELALQWLHSQPTPPAQTVPFAPALWGGTQTGTPARTVLNYPDLSDARRRFSVLIYPDASNAAVTQKKYMIEAVGTCDGATRILHTYVQLVSFAKYNYFSDQSLPNTFWVSGVNSFDGPVHCNNSTGIVNNILWKGFPYPPIFSAPGSDALTVSGSAINWLCGSPTVPLTPQASADWQSVAAGGAASVHVGVPVIDFPKDSTPQEAAALGVASLSGAAIPSTVGVTIPHIGGGGLITQLLNGVLTGGTSGGTATGGVYIHGDVQEMSLDIGISNVQTITILQQDANGPIMTMILLNGLLNQTAVIVLRPLITASVTFYTGQTNGVIYCDGDIGSQTGTKSGGLHGTLLDNQILGALLPSNHLTIATATDKNMNIDGSIEYAALLSIPLTQPVTQPLYALLTQNAGTLGLISNNIEIVDKDALGLPLTQVEIDAAILAFNTCDAADAATRPAGTFRHVGSFIVKHDGTFGVFNFRGTLVSGLSTDRHYDARLVTNPPPSFPTTANQYEVLSWQCVSTTLL